VAQHRPRSLRTTLHAVVLVLGALCLLVGGVAGVANRELLSSTRFAAHVDAVRTDPDVSRQVGLLLTDRLLEGQPDLVAIRPLLDSVSAGVVASPRLGPVVRAGAARVHRDLILGRHSEVVLHLADLAAVLVGVSTVAVPELTSSIPPDLDVRLSRFGGGEYSAPVVGSVHLVQWLAWLLPLLGLLVMGIAGAAFAPGGSSRGERLRRAFRDIGRVVLGAGVALVTLLLVAGVVLSRSDPETLTGAVRRAAWGELGGPLWATAAVGVALGCLLVVAAGRELRSDLSLAGLRRALDPAAGFAVVAPRAVLLGVLGAALTLQPMRVLVALLWASGALLVLVAAGVALLALLRSLRRTRPRLATGPYARHAWASLALVAVVAGLAFGAAPADRDPARATPAATAACNGRVELCDRRYDEVAFPATHNSMAAADEGWFFPEQPDGIIAQLDHGIRVLLIDSWYGRLTNRPGVVTTAGPARDAAVAEATATFGEAAVQSALRLRGAVGLTPQGPTEAYLCHALCELGSTKWLPNLEEVADWLETNPREVVTLFVQDQVSPADTAELIEQAGLLRYVYTPLAKDEWPTLGQMVESGKRLVVLMEAHGGGTAYPWLLQGFDWVQDTPFLFRSPDQFSCAENRGGPEAPLFLVNHWITDKAQEVTNAETVNARDVLLPRLEQCRAERGLLPNFVAVDFYDRGDLMPVVDTLNGLD